MAIAIRLSPEEEEKLTVRAVASGQDVTDYVHKLIKKDIEQPSFAQLFAPIHQAMRDSGMTEPELNALIESAVTDSRQSRS